VLGIRTLLRLKRTMYVPAFTWMNGLTLPLPLNLTITLTLTLTITLTLTLPLTLTLTPGHQPVRWMDFSKSSMDSTATFKQTGRRDSSRRSRLACSRVANERINSCPCSRNWRGWTRVLSHWGGWYGALLSLAANAPSNQLLQIGVSGTVRSPLPAPPPFGNQLLLACFGVKPNTSVMHCMQHSSQGLFFFF
jgi:hypothetical protein